MNGIRTHTPMTKPQNLNSMLNSSAMTPHYCKKVVFNAWDLFGFSESAELPPLAELNGTIGENQTQDFAQDIPPEGTTIILRTAKGTVAMYGLATVGTPNSALNDFNLTATEGQGPVLIFIGFDFFGFVNGGKRPQVWPYDLNVPH